VSGAGESVKKTVFILISLMTLIVFSAQAQEAGGIIEFGGQRWVVLDVQDGYALIITENVKIIGTGQYNRSGINISWANSTMRSYLNNEYLNIFSEEERARIRETYVITNNNPWYDVNGGGNIMDKVFLLSLEEVVRYFGDSGQMRIKPDNMIDRVYLSDMYDSARIARDDTGRQAFWWLRSPGSAARLASGIDARGTIWMYGTGVSNDSLGARPALWLKL